MQFIYDKSGGALKLCPTLFMNKFCGHTYYLKLRSVMSTYSVRLYSDFGCHL